MTALFVGIDVSKDRLDAACLPVESSFQVSNTPAGHRQLLKNLHKIVPNFETIRVVLESTGGLELPVAIALEEAGVQLVVIKPERARYYAKAQGKLAKTDALDAKLLAEFARDVKVPITRLPPEDLRQFRELLDRREQLTEMRTMESNRLGSTTLKQARKSLEKHIAWIDAELKSISKELDQRIAANPQWAETDRILQSIPGVGEQTSRVLIGCLPELGKVSRQTIGSLVGVAPIANDSGKNEGLRHIVGGRKKVRNILYMAALSASAHNPIAKILYRRLRERGRSAKAALIAVAHKLLTIANAMVANKTLWRHSNAALYS